MNCRKAEKLISKDLDNRLSLAEKKLLEEHFKLCPACAEAKKEYSRIVRVLREEKLPQPAPGYLNRLLTRIEEKPLPFFSTSLIWQRWALKALPLTLILILILIGSLVLISPQPAQEISRAELLLQNKNPFTESQEFLEEPGIETKSIRLIFTSLDENSRSRRYLP